MPLQMAAAAYADEASGPRRAITSSATRVRPKRKVMRTEAQAQGAGSVSLESARGVGGKRPRKRPWVREAASLTKAICFKVPLCEARAGSRWRSASPAGLQNRRGSGESSASQEE
ncbi:hypothetical protein ERJ75_001332600 [Trypanosoma vivax]|nr:hypothetical protein ERJ75_001332600 [Trypanosoma vivax]